MFEVPSLLEDGLPVGGVVLDEEGAAQGLGARVFADKGALERHLAAVSHEDPFLAGTHGGGAVLEGQEEKAITA